MYPTGHARNTTADLEDMLRHKFGLLGSIATNDVDALLTRVSDLGGKSASDVMDMFNFDIKFQGRFE
jgi:2-methylcitrate dehydratase